MNVVRWVFGVLVIAWALAVSLPALTGHRKIGQQPTTRVDRELQPHRERRAAPTFPACRVILPAGQLPEWAQWPANLEPLHHCVDLVRYAVFGFEGWVDLALGVALVVFGVIMWRVAIHAMTRKLIDQ